MVGFETVTGQPLDDYAQRAEDDAVRFRTDAALKSLASDLEDVRSVHVTESSLDDWRAQLRGKMEALTSELQQELDAHVPDAGGGNAGSWMEEYDAAQSVEAAPAPPTGAPPSWPAGPQPMQAGNLTSSGRADIMAELARREASRAELLAALIK
jgi:hypothetical protein